MFCKYCGKEVPDGQVCSCQTQQAAQPQYQQAAPTTINVNIDFGAIVKDFKGWVKNYTSCFSWLTTGVFGVASYLLYSVFFMCLLGSLDQKVGIAFWFGLLALIVGFVATVGLLSIRDLVAKQNINIQAHISRFFGVSLLNAGILLVGGLASLISLYLGAFFVFAAITVRVRDYFNILSSFFKEKRNVLATLIIVGVIALILTIGTLITFACMEKGYEGYLMLLELAFIK